MRSALSYEAMGRAFAAVACVGCVAPAAETAQEATGEVALVRIHEGDTLSAIADHLAFPGGWRALARANGLAGDTIRAGAGLRVPMQGIDRYAVEVEPFDPPAPPRALVPCRSEVMHADSCVGTLCIDTLPAVDPDAEGWDELADGAIVRRQLPRQVLRVGDRLVTEIPNGGVGDFEAHRVDLDGDRRDELVLAFPIEVRNHEGWELARVIVVGEAGVTQLDVAHWGTGSLIEAEPGRCDLLATSWEDLDHPLDGPGVYLVGRPLRYEHGALVPRGEEVVRRMRTYFHVDTAPRPAEWLADSPWWHELGARARDVRRGKVVAAERSEDGVELDIVVGQGATDVVFYSGAGTVCDRRQGPGACCSTTSS